MLRNVSIEAAGYMSAWEGMYVGEHIYAVLRQYFVDVFSKCSGKFLGYLENGYVPMGDDEDKVFMADETYNGKYEYMNSLYYAMYGLKWLDFWYESEFKLKISRNL
jgi:hypothetical protein